MADGRSPASRPAMAEGAGGAVARLTGGGRWINTKRLREDGLLNVVHALGLVGLVAGVAMLSGTDIGGDAGAALAGVASQAALTVPAALAMLGAAVANVAAGAILIRLLGGGPYSGLGQAAVGGLVGAVLLDCLLLAVLAGVGLFDWPLLIAAHLAVFALAPLARPFLVPVVAAGGWQWRSIWPFAWLLFLLVWAGPLIIQLASPVVPFLDVLPNHVAPVEHLRVFAGIESLATTPSPIYGPSRIFLGYGALLGTLVATIDVAAVTAVAAFALPLTVLVALAGRGLAVAIGGPRAGLWALLLVPLSVTFLRLPDARAGVLAFPLLAFALWLLIEPLGAGRWRRSIVLGAALGATLLVHPLLGLLAVAAVALLALARLARYAEQALPAAAGALVLATPQWLTMAGLAMPPWAMLLGVLPALAVGWLVDALLCRLPVQVRGLMPPLTAGVVLAGLAAALLAPRTPSEWIDGLLALAADYGVLIAAGGIAVVLTLRRPGMEVVGAGIAAVLLAGVVAGLVPAEGTLGAAIRFEVPKTLAYLAPTLLAVAGAVGLAALWERRRWPLALRVVLSAAVLVAAATPLRDGVVEDLGLGEHRLSESLSISLRNAGRGYWQGFPDARMLVNGEQAQLVEALRRESATGALHRDDQVLHVARSFQPWVAAPLAAFAGVIETTATLDPEDSIHTAGGRLRDIADLPALLAGTYRYVVLEPAGLDASVSRTIEDAGYGALFSNAAGTLFVRATER